MGKKNIKEALADETEQLVHKIIESGVDAIIGGFPCQDARLTYLRTRPDIYPPQLCGGGIRVTQRLHGIGNGNPPCIIRELTKNLTPPP